MCFTDLSLDDVFSSQIVTTKHDFRPFNAGVLNAFVRMIALNIQLLEKKDDPADPKSLVKATLCWR